ncbi:MAG: MBL fold metallo-hydrolase [Opitutaceae bacterium]|nr:MBL fold metallo-hydrolase [Opitutaceae bacterium]
MAAGPPFPVSDHCDGWRFFNPTGSRARSFGDLPKWWWQRWRSRLPAWPASVPPLQPVCLPPTVPVGHLAATFIGQATFLLQFPELTVLTDPVFSERTGPFGVLGSRRIRPPALSLEELPPVDLVLLSHNHYDHLDLAALRWLAQHRRPRIVVPLGVGAWLAARHVTGAIELDWWQSHAISAGNTVVCTPAQHWSSRLPWDRCRTLWGGFGLKTPSGTVFFCGDSGYGPHFSSIGRRLGSCDLALLPIGAYEPRWFMQPMHMNPEEAVRAHRDLGARRSVAMHFGTIRLADEAFDEPLHALGEARRAQGVTGEEFLALDFGETGLFPLGRGSWPP